jgi:hypothetical protein
MSTLHLQTINLIPRQKYTFISLEIVEYIYLKEGKRSQRHISGSILSRKPENTKAKEIIGEYF